MFQVARMGNNSGLGSLAEIAVANPLKHLHANWQQTIKGTLVGCLHQCTDINVCYLSTFYDNGYFYVLWRKVQRQSFRENVTLIVCLFTTVQHLSCICFTETMDAGECNCRRSTHISRVETRQYRTEKFKC